MSRIREERFLVIAGRARVSHRRPRRHRYEPQAAPVGARCARVDGAHAASPQAMSSAVPDELAGEQRHLDVTWSVFERLLRALVRRGRTGVDDFADEALARMRAERIRVYTSASGPLYFGRIDRADGDILYIGRHAIADERNELLAINWRAPAAAPFYAATRADHHGVTRRRRLDVEERRV